MEKVPAFFQEMRDFFFFFEKNYATILFNYVLVHRGRLQWCKKIS